MSSLSAMPNFDQAFPNYGKPVVGNTGVANPNNNVAGAIPTAGGATVFNPGTGVGTSGATPMGNNNGGLVSSATSLLPTNGGSVTSPTPSNPMGVNPGVGIGGVGQLDDIFGNGVGGIIAQEFGDLGSDNSSYIKSYEAAMAQPNAENLATLDTTMGNQGVSGNSSTAAIANADFESGVTSQEGLQEQQLLQNQLQEQVGLTESLEGPAAQETADSSPWAIFGDIAGGASNLAEGAGMLALGGIL